MTLWQLHIIYYIRARGKEGEERRRRGEKGNLAENRKAQWLGSTGRMGGREEGRKEGREGERKEGRGEGREGGRKRRETKDKREIFSYVVGISLLLIP